MDAHIPEELLDRFDHYPAIIRPVVLGRDQLDARQLEIAVEHGLLKRPTKTVVGCDRGVCFFFVRVCVCVRVCVGVVY